VLESRCGPGEGDREGDTLVPHLLVNSVELGETDLAVLVLAIGDLGGAV